MRALDSFDEPCYVQYTRTSISVCYVVCELVRGQAPHACCPSHYTRGALFSSSIVVLAPAPFMPQGRVLCRYNFTCIFFIHVQEDVASLAFLIQDQCSPI